jgi:hypothetical protein
MMRRTGRRFDESGSETLIGKPSITDEHRGRF